MSRFAKFCLLLPLALIQARGEETGVAYFEKQVLPLLRQRCLECHSHGTKIKGGLALDLKAGWEVGGDHGPAIVPGDPEQSRLIRAVRYRDPDVEMPPKGKMSPAEIAILEKWVALGAPDPRVGPAVAQSAAPALDLDEARKFWAFQPVRDPAAPAVADAAWPLDEIDRFILAKLEAASLQPSAGVDRYAWLRRVSFDLTGLPPTPMEIADFVNDDAPGAEERVVDRLLGSRAFGERWARHWLDLTGYADQIGTSNNVFAEHAWRYRDYVIGAFQSDKPFDRFLREQIAGDLLPFSTPAERAANLTATGFLVLGDVEIVAVDKLRMELDLVDQQVSKVGTAFLGMTLGCARCHDHKFDPIGLADYYGIAGLFRATDSTYKTDNGVWSSVNALELPETPAERARREVRLAAHEARVQELGARRAAAEREKAVLEPQIKKAAGEARAALEKTRDELAARVKAIDGEIQHAGFFAPHAPRAFGVRDRPEPSDMRITIRGNPHALGGAVPRGVMRVALWGEGAPTIPPGQSGRAQLADWLADPRNPLTARVAVNRIWQKLFGEGLVRTVDYFGTRGERPTHPELLDHLAARFVRDGWSQQQLIRALVQSRAYRMGSEPGAEGLARDPENRLLWRMNRQRLDAEAIRDAMLAAAGTLAPSSGGPALPLEFPENVTSLSPGAVNPPAFSLKRFRPVQDYERTIYLPVIRSAGQPGSARLRDVFDFAQPAQFTGKRAETSVPTQALFLINGDMLRARSAEIARTLEAAGPGPAARIDALWLRVMNRPPRDDERADAAAFVAALPAATAWVELSHALFSSNEFLWRL